MTTNNDNAENTVPVTHGHTAYALARMVDVASPDSHTSPGAAWLHTVAGTYEPDELGSYPEDTISEWADQCVPVYTAERWRVFVDLAAWDSDDEGLTGPDSDMTERAGVTLYVIARNLLQALHDERDETDDDDDDETDDDDDA